jgi:hypothetical protein
MFELNVNLVLFALPIIWAVERFFKRRKARALPPSRPAVSAGRFLGDYILVFFSWAALNLLGLSVFSLAGFGCLLLSIVAAMPAYFAFRTLWDRTVGQR